MSMAHKTEEELSESHLFLFFSSIPNAVRKLQLKVPKIPICSFRSYKKNGQFHNQENYVISSKHS